MKKKYFPIFIEIESYPALVIGGGKVAARKVGNLLEFGATDITVVSPVICPEMKSLISQNRLKYIEKKYKRGMARKYRIVFSATGDPVAEKRIYKDCVGRGVLLNVADAPELCNFIMPATVKRGDLIAAISTQGVAPFYAKSVKEKIADLLPPVESKIIRFAGEFRRRLLKLNELTQSEKNAMFERFLSTNWTKLLSRKSESAAEKTLEKIFWKRDSRL